MTNSPWPKHPIKHVAFVNARTLREDEDPRLVFRYLDISAVGRGVLVQPPVEVTFEDAPSRARRLVQPGDTIVSTVRTYLRAVWPVSGSVDDLVVSTGFAVLTPGPTLDHRYLGWWVQGDSFVQEISARSVGVSYPAINAVEIGNLAIPLPPLGEQRRICDYLDAETTRIDSLIAKKRRMIELVQERLRAQVDSVFSPLEDNTAAIGRFVLNLTQGVSPQAENAPAEGDEWGLLKLSAVKSGRFIPAENKRLPAAYHVDPSLIPRPGDLLVTRSNIPAYVGDVCAVTAESGRVLLCDLIYRLRLDARLDPRFAAAALLRNRARWHLSSCARGTSQSMVKLRGEDVKATPVPLVSLPLQYQVLEELTTAELWTAAVITSISRQLNLLVEHRQALITAAVTGELDVPGAAA